MNLAKKQMLPILIVHLLFIEELSYNEYGEICITGPSLMKSCFCNDSETNYVMRRHDDGKIWIHTGDIGYVDEDGFIYIKNRIKRMIIRYNGHKIFPSQ